MTIRRRGAAVLALLAVALATGPLLAVAPATGPLLAVAPAAADDNCSRPKDPVKPASWEQQRMRLPGVWAVTQGQGQTVAVIDSGVDASRPHLAGHVINGPDLLGQPGGPSIKDCTGHGTGVAAIIAGRPVKGSPFAGVAPGAALVSIRQFEKAQTGQGNRGSTDGLIRALAAAQAAHAGVVNISATTDVDDPRLRAAVRDALAHNLVIVAAAGNDDPTVDDPGKDRKVYFPAAYPGVLAVAASDRADRPSRASHQGSYVDIAAPGDDVVTVAANGPATYVKQSGTSFAAPFVAGTAALVRSYYPRLNAAQVAERIISTADVPPGGRGTPALGAGIVDPYAAVTAVIPSEGAAGARPSASIAAAVRPAVPVVVDHRARNRALVGAGLGTLAALLLLAMAALLPRARARGWQPGRATPTVPD